MNTLHPFERIFSDTGTLSKPHLFRVRGRWFKVDVPSETAPVTAHQAAGDFLRATHGPRHGQELWWDAPALHSAIARRAARHHQGA